MGRQWKDRKTIPKIKTKTNGPFNKYSEAENTTYLVSFPQTWPYPSIMLIMEDTMSDP